MQNPNLHDLIDSALLLALVAFLLYTLDQARPVLMPGG